MQAPTARSDGRWRGFAIAGAFALLAACVDPMAPPPAAPTEVMPAPTESPAQASDADPVNPPEPDPSPGTKTAAIAPPPPSPGEISEPATRLIGLSHELLLDVLGPAGFVRRDGPVQIWRYTGEACFLDVFLYRDGQGFHVKHVEARSKGEGQASLNACYRRLVEARRRGRPG